MMLWDLSGSGTQAIHDYPYSTTPKLLGMSNFPLHLWVLVEPMWTRQIAP